MKSTSELQELITFNRENGWPDLSAESQLFAMAYVETYNMSDSAQAANISLVDARKLLRDPIFVSFVNDLQSHLNTRTVISKDFVHLQWLKLLPKLMGEEPVDMVDKNGEGYQERRFHASEAVSLVKELGKIVGVYDGHNDGEDGSVPLNISFNVSEQVSDVKVTKGAKNGS